MSDKDGAIWDFDNKCWMKNGKPVEPVQWSALKWDKGTSQFEEAVGSSHDNVREKVDHNEFDLGEKVNKDIAAALFDGYSKASVFWPGSTKITKPSDDQVGGDHYKGMAIEPSEFIHRNGIGWLEGNAIKYVCRHSMKHGEQDIDKAIHYLQLLKEWQYGAKKS